MGVKSYDSKVVISGAVVEIYDYNKPVLEGFDNSKSNGKGRRCVANNEEQLKNRTLVLSRARRDLRRLINTNIKDISKFITLTFADNIQDIEAANLIFTNFIRRLSRYLKVKVEYVCVPEFQKRGAIHYHVVMFNVPYIKNKDLQDIWGQGFVRINKIDSVDNVGAYVCKYMSKDFDLDDKLKGKKCYFSSRRLDKPIEIKQNDLVESVRDSLQADKLVYENTFENEYNSTHYVQYNMNKR